MPSTGLKLDKRPKISINKFKSSNSLKNILVAIVTYIIIFIIILSSIMPERYDVKAGEVAQQNIKATKDVVDILTTDRLKEQAMEKVMDTYKLDTDITQNAIDQYNDFFNILKNIRQNAQSMQDDTVEQKNVNDNISTDIPDENQQFFLKYKDEFPFKVSTKDLTTAFTSDIEEINLIQSEGLSLLKKIMSAGIKSDSLYQAKSDILVELQDLDISNEVRTLGYNIICSAIKPNLIYDETTTTMEREKAAEKVEKQIYKKGQNIIKEGEIITREQIAVLDSLGILKNEKIDFTIYIGIGIIIFMLELIVILYLVLYERKLIEKPSYMLLLSCLSILFLFVAYLTAKINLYLIPVSAFAMLLCILINARIAIVINVVLVLLIGLATGNDVNFIIISIVAGSIGVYKVANSQQRNSLVWAGLIVGMTNFLMMLSLGIISNTEINSILSESIWGVGNGVLSSVLTIGTLPMWENLFGIITHVKLLELSNPNQPVLKKLLVEAPGTYHHSIIVSNLAERAAEAVMGNPVLARVGAYYHDIGKLKRPYFFKENQLNNQNPHDKINPNLSTLIITSHTKDGLEIAKRNKLPKVLCDIIVQHHGTTLVAYFYHKAKTKNKTDEIYEENFRYPGPKPQTKESAVIMLADSVEAAVRAMNGAGKGEIDGFIRKIIKEKLDDGQLDESDLTLKDLNKIALAFSEVLVGIFHERIEYPDLNSKHEVE
ncbi:MAG: HDIG domain-containing protein [Clostridia bacterium]|nr:HDIG domain-containing protein [Clostridia bacterium]